jgi:hypothetical protein
MALTSTQLTALKNAINADGTLSALPNNSDGNSSIAAAFNLQAVPDWTIWKKLVPVADIGKKINGTELAGLTSLNHTRLQTIITLTTASGGLDASLADQRQFFDDIFSGAGGTNTRAALLILWKKLSSRAEKLFSTGTGSNASPATTDSNIGMNFTLTVADVEQARNLP